MSAEKDRKDFGMTDRGAVTVIHKVHFADNGGKQISFYEVKHGVRTVGIYDSRTQAENAAKAIAGAVTIV